MLAAELVERGPVGGEHGGDERVGRIEVEWRGTVRDQVADEVGGDLLQGKPPFA